MKSEGREIVTFTYCDVRWQCASCGRFVAEADIEHQDFVDPESYYGVREEYWVKCRNCGCTGMPRCVQTKELVGSYYADEFESD